MIWPGVAWAAAVAAVATVLGGRAPVVGAPVIAIVIGIVISVARPPSDHIRPGLTFTSKKVLQGSIIVLGLGLSVGQVASTGVGSLPVLLGTLAIALAAAAIAGRALGVNSDVKTLVGVGTAICGASAIAAADSVIDADSADVSYAVATIFTFNVVAVLTYPTIGHRLGLSQHAFGLWSGTAINDVSSVVAASTVYGHAAASYAVVVKLTRTLAIVPICLGLSAWRKDRSGKDRRFAATQIFPLWILGFLAAVIVNTLGAIPHGWHHGLADLAGWMITAALAAIGLSTDVSHLRRAGARPMMLGAVLWATVGSASLLLQLR